jgi:hypothetical protein
MHGGHYAKEFFYSPRESMQKSMYDLLILLVIFYHRRDVKIYKQNSGFAVVITRLNL